MRRTFLSERPTAFPPLAYLLALLAIGNLVPRSLCGEEPQPTREQPNLILILVDDLGKDWIGSYGADGVETPHIDELARTGIRFDNVWSMPQCTPTRVTLLTGQYPFRTGWVNHWDAPRWGFGYFDWRCYDTVATQLRAADYAKAIGGKWQINDFRRQPESLTRHGFDDWCVWTGYEQGNPPSANRYWDPYVFTRTGSRTYEGKFGPDLYCDFLIDFLRRHRDQPTFLYYAMALTHGPLVTTPLDREAKAPRERHRAMVRYTDHLVGRLVKEVDALGLRQETIILFTTDNGTAGGMLNSVDGRRLSGGKATLFEGGVCQPLLVNGPGRVPGGRRSDALVDFTDLMPTLVELGNAKLPSGRVIDGRSFAPLLRGTADDSPREWILSMGYGKAVQDQDGVRGRHAYSDRVLRDKRFKVWVDTGRQVTALYDLQNDPGESHNLIDAIPRAGLDSWLRLHAALDTLPPLDSRMKMGCRR